jgi:hypothetical protein
VTTWTYSKDPVTGIPSEGFIASTGRREVFFPRVDDVLPRSGLALKGNKQVQLSGSGIANVSWSLIPLLAGPCKITSISPTTVTLFTGVAQTFTANGKGLAGVKWKAPGATPAAPPESGPTFTTKWRRAGKKTVTATCGGTTKTAKVRVLDVLIDIIKHGQPTMTLYKSNVTILREGSRFPAQSGSLRTLRTLPLALSNWF